jgi:hypothetical protein
VLWVHPGVNRRFTRRRWGLVGPVQSRALTNTEHTRTDQRPPEIVPPNKQLPIVDDSEIPDGGLGPTQYARMLLEEIRFPIAPNNVRAVAAGAIECEAKTIGVMSAYEFVVECTPRHRRRLRDHNIFCTDGKYRPELRNGNGRQVNGAASRSQRTIESLANALVAAKAL